MHPDWLSNAYLLADEEGGAAVYVDSGAPLEPLIEAAAAGLPIVASDIDVVRDVCDPVQTFDPESTASIAQAVRRFLDGAREAKGANSGTKLRIRSSGEFVQELLRAA